MKALTQITLLSLFIFLLTGCTKDGEAKGTSKGLDFESLNSQFPVFDSDTIDLSNTDHFENTSVYPYKSKPVHFFGKRDLGNEKILLLIGEDDGEAFSILEADLFVKGEKVDRMVLAESDLAVRTYSVIKQDTIFLFEETPAGRASTVHLAGLSGFKDLEINAWEDFPGEDN